MHQKEGKIHIEPIDKMEPSNANKISINRLKKELSMLQFHNKSVVKTLEPLKYLRNDAGESNTTLSFEEHSWNKSYNTHNGTEYDPRTSNWILPQQLTWNGIYIMTEKLNELGSYLNSGNISAESEKDPTANTENSETVLAQGRPVICIDESPISDMSSTSIAMTRQVHYESASELHSPQQ